MRRGKGKRKPGKATRKSRPNYRLGCVVLVLVLIPILYGVYMYLDDGTRRQAESDKSVRAGSVNATLVERLQTPVTDGTTQEQIIKHAGYTVSYNKQTRLPNWVGYELTRAETRGRQERTDRFTADPQVKGPAATNDDYSRSGYDKGHIAPAADMKWSGRAMKESFYFSNICPQHPRLNRQGWKELEEKARDWAVADSAIIIVSGPILAKRPKTIGRNQVAVPQRFFKVILSPFAKPMRAIGFLFDNAPATAPLRTYAVTVDSVERATGMDFFAALPDSVEHRVESDLNFALWPN